MRINNNLSALNTQSKLQASQNAMSKSLEKLSSGLRINRASDDAAGLSISEKMRGQIKGLNRAQSNAQEAISLVQTAEGALGETHSMLQRMRELAVQASSDTATAADRSEIQKEVDHLAKEITRISNTTEFNTKNLLSGAFGNGSAGPQKFQIGANEGQVITLAIDAVDAKSLGVAGDATHTSSFSAAGSGTVSTGLIQNNIVNDDIGSNLTGSYTINVQVTNASTGASIGTAIVRSDSNSGTAVVNGTYTGESDKTFLIRLTNTITSTGGDVKGAAYSSDGGTTWTMAAVNEGASASTITLSDGLSINIGQATYNSIGDTYEFSVTAAKAAFTLKDSSGDVGISQTIYGDDTSVTIGDYSNNRTLILDGFSFKDLKSSNATFTLASNQSMVATIDGNGLVTEEAVTQKGISVKTFSEASKAITSIDKAIAKVSSVRSDLGAVQNRLEHTISNLSVTSENMTAAESRIRDVDMAREMSEFTKYQILSQASTAMLAQANQVPQGVMKLLG